MDKIEEKIIKIIDDNKEKLIAFARDIYTHAELGYKEFRTASKFSDELKALGLETKEGLAVTGVKGYLNQDKKENVSLALIGELDALRQSINMQTHRHRELIAVVITVSLPVW